jgi:WD40 repeat protein
VIDDGELLLVNAADGKKVAKLASTPGKAVAASENGDLARTVVEASAGGVLRLFDPMAGKERASFRFPDGEKPRDESPRRPTVWLSPDDRFACVSTDRSVYLLRLPPADEGPDREAEKDRDEGQATGGMELVRKIGRWREGRLVCGAVSKGGEYALVTFSYGSRGRMSCAVYEVAGGKEVMACSGYHAAFLGDGSQVVTQLDGEFRVYENRTGQLLRSGKHALGYRGMKVAPGDGHVAYWGPEGYGLFDLTTMKELHSWKQQPEGEPVFSFDGKHLFVPVDDRKPWIAWDVAANRESKDFRLSGKLQFLFPDNRTAAIYQDGNLNRIELRTGKVVGELTERRLDPPVYAINTPDCRWYVGRFKDGSLRQYRLPFDKPPAARYRLPPDDRAVPTNTLPNVMISSDSRYAALLTTKALYVLRLAQAEPRR